MTWRVYLVPVVATICLRDSEKWTQSALITGMKNPILTRLLSFLTVIYIEIPSFVSISPGTAQISQHTRILSNISTTILFLQTQPTSSSSLQQKGTPVMLLQDIFKRLERAGFPASVSEVPICLDALQIQEGRLGRASQPSGW